MADAKDLDQKKKPGEQPPGKFHYNPGNMAGKTVNDVTPPEGERTNDDSTAHDERADRKPGRSDPQGGK